MTRAFCATVLVTALASMTASVTAGCKTLEKSAQQDPLKCERDAKCDKKRGRTMDCSMQCNDDPACMNRCEQVRAPSGPLGH